MTVIFSLEVILLVGGSENVKQKVVVQYKADLKPISKWWWYSIYNFHVISLTNCINVIKSNFHGMSLSCI